MYGAPRPIIGANLAGSMVQVHAINKADGGVLVYANSVGADLRVQGIPRTLVQVDVNHKTIKSLQGHCARWKFRTGPGQEHERLVALTVSDTQVVESGSGRRFLVSGGYDRTVKCWDGESAAPIAQYEHMNDVLIVSAGLDQQGCPIVLSADEAGLLILARIETDIEKPCRGRWRRKPISPNAADHALSVTLGRNSSAGVAFATYGFQVATKSATAVCYDLETSKAYARLKGFGYGAAGTSALNVSGTILAVGTCEPTVKDKDLENKDRVLRLFDVRKSSTAVPLLGQVETRMSDCNFITFSPDERLVVCGDMERVGHVYDLRRFREPLHVFTHPLSSTFKYGSEDREGLHFGGWTSGGLFLSGGGGAVRFWDFGRGSPMIRSIGDSSDVRFDGEVTCATLSDDETVVVVGTGAGSIYTMSLGDSLVGFDDFGVQEVVWPGEFRLIPEGQV
ncbi:WD40 repeat-like protein [Gonapodya prolifera JEL478]|uniref:WD40 repeat-like protein n=1 Tax=Gonapodya prolifera (strain JEL478) TaxID=1344416 RepID=A0A139AFW9_GONPJ|nr:WD40 repeat-like protein [Gonapodya prolifera JEL478]|eukprot:KXS15313.1 WD40 repeat-like protein [Gonapodya prolifera JEL478]